MIMRSDALLAAYEELNKYHLRSDVHPKEALHRAIAVYLKTAQTDDMLLDDVATAINCMEEQRTSDLLGVVLYSSDAVAGDTPEDAVRDLRRLCRDIAGVAIGALGR